MLTNLIFYLFITFVKFVLCSVQDILYTFQPMDTVSILRIPVVARDDPLQLPGVLRRHDIIRAYSRAAAKAKKRGLA